VHFLVTAGNTQTPIDQVRCITNVFTGRTGGTIASEAHRRGHHVTLLTSHPEVVTAPADAGRRWHVLPYRTFDDLDAAMATRIQGGNLDVVIHSAAVSDYSVAGTYAPAFGSTFDPNHGSWTSKPSHPKLMDVSRGKVRSSHPELWLRLVPTHKIIDRIRTDWGFRGVLVKFKLEVDVTDEELLRIAEASRVQSQANLMVANTYNERHAWAFLGPIQGKYQRISRSDLASRLLDEVEEHVRSKPDAPAKE
jgi:phosphopantothenoylcysteine synthetase/decarboxylase